MICAHCRCPIEKGWISWIHRSLMDAVRCVKSGGSMEPAPAEEVGSLDAGYLMRGGK